MYLCPVPFPTSPHLPCFSVFPASQVKSRWVGGLLAIPHLDLLPLTEQLHQTQRTVKDVAAPHRTGNMYVHTYSKGKGVMCLSVYISVWEGGGRAQAAWTRIRNKRGGYNPSPDAARSSTNGSNELAKVQDLYTIKRVTRHVSASAHV